jgi:hypothetical protein
MNTFISGFWSFMSNFCAFLIQEVFPRAKLHKKGLAVTLSGISLLIAILVGSTLKTYFVLALILGLSILFYSGEEKKFFNWVVQLGSQFFSWLSEQMMNVLSGKKGLHAALIGWTTLLAVIGFSQILPKEQTVIVLGGSLLAFVALVLVFIEKQVNGSDGKK